MINQFIYPIKDIDDYIISFLNQETLFNIGSINKYYNELINNLNLIKEINLFKKINKFNFENPNQNFITCCENGWVTLAEYLFNKFKINIHDNNDYAFYISCLAGQLEIVKWLFEIGQKTNSLINVHICDDINFAVSCAHGHLEVAKWLIEMGKKLNSSINIETWDNSAFKWSCQNNHFEVAKWLLTIGIDLNEKNIYEINKRNFIASLINSNLEISKFICSIDNRFNLEEKRWQDD